MGIELAQLHVASGLWFDCFFLLLFSLKVKNGDENIFG